MTLHATRDGQKITVHGNVGTEVLVQGGHVQHVRITENAQHVRFFHDQIGKLLDAADEERDAQAEPPHQQRGVRIAEHTSTASGHHDTHDVAL